MTEPDRWHESVPDRVVAALDDAFPERTVAEVSGTGPSWNDQNRTARVGFTDGGTAFLKVATDGDGTRVARECAVTDYVGDHTDVAVPDVLAADPEGDPPYLATAPLGEHSLRVQWDGADEATRQSLLERVGVALAALHEQRFDAHGHVVGGGAGGLDIDTGAWTDVLLDRIDYIRSVAPARRFDDHFDRVATVVEANRDVLDDARAALVHGDPAMPNCFPRPDAVGFVDWEAAHVGDPARELHRATDQLLGGTGDDVTDRLLAALEGGYRERAGSLPAGSAEREPVYDAVRYLGHTGFYERWVEFVDEDRETLARKFETEMERRLEAAR
jgi:aminoglycoside phosphotransferase